MSSKTSQSPLGEFERILAAANDSRSFPERMQWLFHVIEWISQHRAELVPQRLIFEPLERNPKIKSKCARTLRSLARDLSATDFLIDVDARENNVAQIPETDILHVMNQVFAESTDVKWFATIDPEVVRGFFDLLSFEAAPNESSWNHYYDDVRQALVLLGSQMRLTAREWVKSQRQDRSAAFDQTQYPRIGLLIDQLIIVRSQHQHDEALAIAQELYNLVRQCRRQVDGIRQNILAIAWTREEVQRADVLFRQLSRLKTLVNIYTHRSSFHRDAVKLVLPLVDGLQNTFKSRLSRQHHVMLWARQREKQSVLMQTDSRSRKRTQAGLGSALTGGLIFSVIAAIFAMSSDLEPMMRIGISGTALALGVLIAAVFNFKFFNEMMPFDLHHFGKLIREVAGRDYESDRLAEGLATSLKTHLFYLIANCVAVLPSVFWLGLLTYIMSHHRLVSPEDGLETARTLSSWSACAAGGILSGLAWLAATLVGTHFQTQLKTSYSVPASLRKAFKWSRAHAAILTTSLLYAIFFTISELGLQTVGPSWHAHAFLLDFAWAVLAMGANAGAIFKAKLFTSCLVGLGIVLMTNLAGCFGAGFLVAWIGQYHRPSLNLSVFFRIFSHLKPAARVISMKDGRAVAYDASSPSAEVPEWMAASTRAPSTTSGQVIAHPKIAAVPQAPTGVPHPPTAVNSSDPTVVAAAVAPARPQRSTQSSAIKRSSIATGSQAAFETLAPQQNAPIEIPELASQAPVEIVLGEDRTEIASRPSPNERTEIAHRTSANERTEIAPRSSGNERTEVVGAADRQQVFDADELTDPGFGERTPPPILKPIQVAESSQSEKSSEIFGNLEDSIDPRTHAPNRKID